MTTFMRPISAVCHHATPALAALAFCLSCHAAQTVSFSIGANFDGSSSTGFIPPDTMGGVGPSHVVELINGGYAIYNKTGTLQTSSSLNAFWTAAGVTPAGSFAFDPRVVYDPQSSRWFAAAVDNGGGANNFLVAVSDSSDPTAGWTGFQVDSDADDSHWADFPMLGLNDDVLTITANMFGLGTPAPAATTTTLVFPKSDLLLGSPTVANRTAFENVSGSSTGFSMQPVVDLDGGNLPLGLLSSYAKSNPGTGYLKASSIGGTATSPTLNVGTGFPDQFIGVVSRSDPPDIDQPGTKQDIDAGDARFSGNVVERGGSLYAVQGVEVSGRAAIEYYVINASTLAVITSGLISDSSLAFNYPSISVNQDGVVVIGYSGGDPGTYMSTYVSVGQDVAGVLTFGTPVQTQAGSADYQLLDSATPPRNRWGDYSATVVDPSNGNHFWTFQEYASATDTWTVRITEIMVPEPSEVALFSAGLLGVFGLARRVRGRRAAKHA